MAAVTKASLTIDTSGLVDGQTIDAADFTTPHAESLALHKEGYASVSAADTHVGHLEDKVVGTAGKVSVTKQSAGADESLAVDLDATGITNTYVPTADGADDWDWAAQTGGASDVIDVTVTAGENLAQRDIVYLDGLTAWKVDTDDSTPKMSTIRGVVVETGGITSGNTGDVRLQGVVDGFTALSAGSAVYASTTAGGYTQTKPEPTDGGSQVVVARIGTAISTTEVLVQQQPVRYMKRASLADDGTLTVVHHTDALGRSRDVSAYLSVDVSGAQLTIYADTNQDEDVGLEQQTVATYGSDETGSGTASASNEDSGYEAYRAFADDGFAANSDCWLTQSGTTTGWLKYDFGSGVTKTARRYTLAPPTSANSDRAPADWTFEGSNDDSNWDVLDTRSGESFSSSVKTYDFDNATAYRYYRLNISANGGSVGRLGVGEMEIIEAATFNDGADLLAQGFQVTGAQTVGSVKLYMKKVGSPTGNLTAKIYTDSGGDPDSLVTNGTSDTVAASSLGTSYGWVTFTFSTPPSLSGSTQYWIRLETTDSQSETDYVVWGADGSTPGYANGEMKSTTDDGSTWDAESKDAIFEVLAVGYTYEEPAAIQRWSLADTLDVAVRFDDGSGSNASTNTHFKNVTGSTADVTCVVELD